jgi:hypothetical protein
VKSINRPEDSDYHLLALDLVAHLIMDYTFLETAYRFRIMSMVKPEFVSCHNWAKIIFPGSLQNHQKSLQDIDSCPTLIRIGIPLTRHQSQMKNSSITTLGLSFSGQRIEPFGENIRFCALRDANLFEDVDNQVIVLIIR